MLQVFLYTSESEELFLHLHRCDTLSKRNNFECIHIKINATGSKNYVCCGAILVYIGQYNSYGLYKLHYTGRTS